MIDITIAGSDMVMIVVVCGISKVLWTWVQCSFQYGYWNK